MDEARRELGTSPEEKRFLFSGAPTPEAASPVGRDLTKNKHFKDTAALTSTLNTQQQATITRKYEQFHESLETLQSVVALLHDRVDQMDSESSRLRADLSN